MCQCTRGSLAVHLAAMSAELFAAERLGMPRHTPPVFSSLLMVPVRITVQFWPLDVPHSHSWIFESRRVRHTFGYWLMRIVPFAPKIQAWPGVPLHQNMSTLAPFEPMEWKSSA